MTDRDDVKADLARYGQKDGDVLYLAALREIEALEAEAQAMVAAAYETAADAIRNSIVTWIDGVAYADVDGASCHIYDLASTDHAAALDKRIAEAERRGMERAINIANGCDRVCEVGPAIRTAMDDAR